MLCSQHGRILAQSRRRDRGQVQQRGAVVEGSVQVRPAPPHGVSAPLVIPLSSPCSDFCVSVCLPPLLLVCASPLPFCLAPPLRLSPLSAPHPFVLLGCSASLLCANSSQLRRAQRIPTAASTPRPKLLIQLLRTSVASLSRAMRQGWCVVLGSPCVPLFWASILAVTAMPGGDGPSAPGTVSLGSPRGWEQ